MADCPNCGHADVEDARFCSECGTRLDTPAVSTRDVRKTVTIVFCDVTGSTALGERLDPESLRTVMSRYFERMQAVLESHGGTVEKFIGDAVMAVFGIPTVHEDDAVRAVRAAHQMRAALEELNNDLERELAVRLEIRIGVNTGPVVAGSPAAGQALVTGDAVNTAARLEQTAEPGEILIGEETFGLVRDVAEAEPVVPRALKGKAAMVGASRLISVQAVIAGHERRLDSPMVGHERRLDSPMVGRERQLRMVLDVFDAASADAACHLFTVLGPAGIGKSRLVREFVSALGGQAQVVSGRCLSYGEGITLWPLAQMVIQAASIAEDDSPEHARAALGALLEGVPEGEAVASHLAGMLGLDGAALVEPTWAVRRLFEALGRRRPLVAVFDDIHWAEPTLLDVIEHVADWSRDVPILLLCMARLELLDDRPGWSGGKRNASSVHLEPLSEPEADALIENLLGHPALTPEVRGRIRAAAQGNPLFVEEMLSMLVDDGMLIQRDGEWVATVDLSTVQVPPAISAVLASRLDRLSAQERLVVNAASIVGEVFDRAAIGALVPEAVPIDRHLGSLVLKDVIRPSPSEIGPTEGFRFRHILLRDAAYEAILKSERAELHEAFAGHLRTSLGERASEFDEFVGYHLEQAFRMRDELGLHDERTSRIARSAFDHLSNAGRRAFQRSDMPAASDLMRHAVDLLDEDDPDRLLVCWELGHALVDTGSLEAARQLLDETIAHAEATGHEAAATYAHCAAMMYVHLAGSEKVKTEEWEATADRSVSFFEASNDTRGLALAWSVRTFGLWFGKQVEACARAAERAIGYARETHDRIIEAEVVDLLLASLAYGPTPLDEAIPTAETTLAHARARGDRRLEPYALRYLGYMHGFRGSFEVARQLLAEARALLQELGITMYYLASAQILGRVEWLAGDLDEAARVLRESCDALEALGERAFLSTNATILAQVEIERGNVGEAERWIETAERTGSPDDRATQIGIHHARGLLLLARREAAAEEELRLALQMVDETDMLLWRAVLRYESARALAIAQPDEAADLAREGIALAEAKKATALVDQLGGLLRELERA